MILKSYEINKINQNIKHLILFYGRNEGLKNEALDVLIKNKNNISYYEEKEILDNENVFIENILSKSLFEQKKSIIIKRATDKILKIIEILHLKDLEDITILINAENLEKKSKLRSFFEKDKN
jgi:DNA polymerase-3 subunit delta